MFRLRNKFKIFDTKKFIAQRINELTDWLMFTGVQIIYGSPWYNDYRIEIISNNHFEHDSLRELVSKFIFRSRFHKKIISHKNISTLKIIRSDDNDRDSSH